MDIEWLVGIYAGVLHSMFVRFLYHKVPEPYMDEEFHVNQTRTYCSGEFFSWNPKITTPPAVYVLALPFFCGRERYFNSALLPICFVGLCRLRRKWSHASSRTDCLLSALITISLPVLLDTSFLFYTDLLSLTCVVWGFNTSCPIISAVIFAIGVLTRQTNIVWAAMYCFMAWIKNLDKKKPISSTLKCVWKHFAFVILAGAFTAFVVWNKGIVLGDKTAHQPVFHVPQFLYFLLFTSFSSFPIFVSKALNRKGFIFKVFRHPFLSLIFIVVTLFSIHFFTYSHPYLLADNRHFTFYMWRKIFARHWIAKFMLSPFYLIGIYYFICSTAMPQPYVFALIFCTCACVIPAHLLEFRYFIIPYVLWRLSVVERSNLVLICELAYCICLNIACLYIFVTKTFEWRHQPGPVQRFMW